MKRITIKCSYEDSKGILKALENDCPFMFNYPDSCGDESCSKCIDRYVGFEIIENKEE